MTNITVIRDNPANPSLLTEEIQAVYVSCAGVSTRGNQTTAHFPGVEFDPTDVTAVEALITNHNGAQTTSEQDDEANALSALQTILDVASGLDYADANTRIGELNSDVGGVLDSDAAQGLANIAQALAAIGILAKHVERLENVVLVDIKKTHTG